MSGLERKLGLAHIVFIASGALISSGLFVLPGIAHGRAGPAVVVSYLLAGLLAAVGLLSVAELTTAMPKAGGDYFFISRALGSGTGTVAGLLSWFSISLKSAFALVGIGALAELALPVDGRIVGAVFLAVFSLLNIHGVKKAANLQVVLGVLLMLLLGGFVAAGLRDIDAENFRPLAPNGWTAVFSTAGFVFVAFGAAMQVAGMAEDIRDPGRNVPRGIGISIILVTLLYVAVIGVATGVLPGERLDYSMTPISDAAGAFLGRPGMIVMSAGALIAFLTTANAGILTSSRYLLALSEDDLAPAVLSRLRGGTGSPWAAVLATTGLLAAAILVPLKVLVESASAVFVIMYILASISIIVLREGRVQNYRPVFTVPLYPYLQIAGIAGFVFVLIEMGYEALLIAGGLVIGAFSLYLFYGRRRRSAESALIHLIERVTDRELIEGDLEDELRDIIRKRDGIGLDRIYRLIERAEIIDLEGPSEAGEFFDLASARIAPAAGADPRAVSRTLSMQEGRTGTVVKKGVAVPHLVFDGEGVY